MKYLLDSSVLIAAFLEPHPMHTKALPWLSKAKAGKIDWVVASHSIAEVYSVLTTLPLTPKLLPSTAWRLIEENIPKQVIKSLTSSDYVSIIKEIAELGLKGGIVYDALIAKIAQKSKADKILTFNVTDFKRVWPQGEKYIMTP